MTAGSTIVYVVFGIDHLDISRVLPEQQVVIVHNDDSLALTGIAGRPAGAAEIIHLRGHGNVGFAAGANLGLNQVTTARVLFCNPDTALLSAHWRVLSAGSPEEVVSVPMIDRAGRPASVINAYPTPLSIVLSGYRAGRVAGRGSLVRTMFQPLLGAWGSSHRASSTPQARLLGEAWCSGALFSIDTARIRSVGGFDDGYFLYFEDTDVCRRLAIAFPDMTVRVADVVPALHEVGGSAHDAGVRRAVDRHLVSSAIRYASSPEAAGWRWRAARAMLKLRAAWLARQ